MMDRIYLDNNATTCPAPEVVAAMHEAAELLWANPSSIHRFGQAVRQRVELARASVARLIGAKPRELLFTSGGTESNNLALSGLSPDVLLVTTIEHVAVREPAEAFESTGGRFLRLAVGPNGLVDPAELELAVAKHRHDAGTVLVSIQWANNETGMIQPMARLAEVVARQRAAARADHQKVKIFLHTDATQAVGKLPVDVGIAGVDLLSASAHKFHGPKGVGVLWCRSGLRLNPIQRGGPQEWQRRGGTENTTAIIGAGVAADLAVAFLSCPQHIEELAALRNRFERGVVDAVTGALVNGIGAPRLWNTSNIAFFGLAAEAILLGLSERGLCASAGAACSSGSLDPSPVLLAMGVDEPMAHGSIRFSLSRGTTSAEIDGAIKCVPEVVSRLQRIMPMVG